MSEEQAQFEESSMSAEDKFLGVKTTITKKAEQADVDIEVVDDRAPEDRKPAQKEKQAKSDDDDELAGYGDKVKKRINKLRYEQHEERRRREDAERMREEAIRVAKQYAEQNQNLQRILSQGEGVLLSQSQKRAEMQLAIAEARLRQAVEEGNTDAQIQAQKDLNAAQMEVDNIGRRTSDYQRHRAPRPESTQQQQYRAEQEELARRYAAQQAQEAQQPAQVKPSDKAMSWAENNKWFQSEDHMEMTAYAYGVHQTLIQQEGVDPESDEYYDELDRRVHARFPEYFDEESSGSVVTTTSSTSRSPSVVVAPSARNNGAKPRKVKLSRTQVALAKRLGLTPEQYANQLLKES